MKLKKTGLGLKGLFNCSSSATCKFPKFVVFMIISDVFVEVFDYNPLRSRKQYKHFHRRIKTYTTFM